MQPLVPADVDLRGMPFMPLDVNRLRDSELAIKESAEAFRAAVMLWCASWGQVPAASLPNDDVSLAAYAGLGRDMKSWRKVRPGALRGFVLCDDGRLYHPVVAEKALEAWSERQEYREGRANEKDRKARERDWRKRAFAALRSIDIVPGYDVKTAVLRAMIQEKGLVVPSSDNGVTSHVPVTVTGHGPDTAKTGTGTGTGIKDLELPEDKSSGQTDGLAVVAGTDLSPAERKAILWKRWKQTSGDNGSLLGKMCKAHGEAAVLDAVEKVLALGPAEPKAYLRRVLDAAADADPLAEFMVGAI